jgi:hypothetical protein
VTVCSGGQRFKVGKGQDQVRDNNKFYLLAQ